MLLNAWCIMTNHLHLILSSKTGSLSALIRDFKKYTSHQLIHSIRNNPSESRCEWMLIIFTEAGTVETRVSSSGGRACPAPDTGIIILWYYTVLHLLFKN